MRIHSDHLTVGDIHYAANRVLQVTGSAFYVDVTVHGSRRRTRAFNVLGSSDGKLTRKRVNPGRSSRGGNLPYSATWEQWGHFLAALFAKDDTLTIPRVYVDRDSFNRLTSYEFALEV